MKWGEKGGEKVLGSRPWNSRTMVGFGVLSVFALLWGVCCEIHNLVYDPQLGVYQDAKSGSIVYTDFRDSQRSTCWKHGDPEPTLLFVFCSYSRKYSTPSEVGRERRRKGTWFVPLECANNGGFLSSFCFCIVVGAVCL